jgi:hypothetical protein
MLQPAMEKGRLAYQRPGLETIRHYAGKAVDSLPAGTLRGSAAVAMPGRSADLQALRASAADRLEAGRRS